MYVTALEQMGYPITQKRMHSHRGLLKKNVPLMESEKTKPGHPFQAPTASLSGPLDLAPTGKHHEVTDLLTMSNVSEEEAEEKEAASSTQDIALLCVVEEQVWSRLSNPLERGTSVELERGQGDPGTWTGFSQGESNFKLQGMGLENTPLKADPRECGTAYCSRGHQSSLAGNPHSEQDSTPLSKAAVEQLQDHTIPFGFPQAPDIYDTLPQTQYGETLWPDSFPPQEDAVCRYPLMNHGIAKCHQNAVPSKSKSDEDGSWEWKAEPGSNKGHVPEMETIGGSDEEMASKTVRDSEGQPSVSAGNEDKEIELMRQNNDVDPSASHKCSEFSKGRRLKFDAGQARPNVTLSSSPSKAENSHSDAGEKGEDLEEKLFICDILHLWEDDEEENIGGDQTHSLLKEGSQTEDEECDPDGGESEPTQKELENIEHGKKEVPELEDTDGREEEDLGWKEMEKAMKTEQEKLGRDQEWDMEVQTISREEVQHDSPGQSLRPGMETLYSLENDSMLLEFNKNSSLVEAEGLAVPLKEPFPLEGCLESASVFPEPHIQTAKANTVLMSKSPNTPPGTGQREYSGGGDHASCIPHSGEDSDRGRKEGSKNVGDGERIRTSEGEEMALLMAETLNPQGLSDFQLVDHPADDEWYIPASLPRTRRMAGSEQEDTDKGVRDVSVDYTPGEEQSNSMQESLGAMVCREASVLSSDFSGIQTHHRQTTTSKDVHGEMGGSVPKNVQATHPGEGLCRADKEGTEGSLVSSFTPESLQAQDADANYLEKCQQHLKLPERNLVLPGNESEVETLCIMQETTLDEPQGLVVLEEGRTECEHHSEVPTSPDTCTATASHIAEFQKPLSLVLAPDQTQTCELVSGQLTQPSLPPLDASPCSWFGTASPNVNVLTEHPDAGADPKHPIEPLEFLPSSSQTRQSLVLQAAPVEPLEFAVPTLDTIQPLAAETVPNDSVCPTPNANRSIQSFITDSNQIREVTAPEPKPSLLLPQIPVLDFNTDLHNLSPVSTSSIPPATGHNQVAQQSVESSLAADAQNTGSVLVATFVSHTLPSVLEPESHARSRKEEHVRVPLSKFEDGGASEGQGNLNIGDSLSDSGIRVLVPSSNSVILGNDPSVLNPSWTPEAMVNIMDKHDGKSSSDGSSHPSLWGQRIPGAVGARTPLQPPPVLAFTNPIHFFQPGPPSPPTSRHAQKRLIVPQGLHLQQMADAKIDTLDSVAMQQVAEGFGRHRMGLEKPEVGTSRSAFPRKEEPAKHPPLEKSTSCPNKSMAQDTRDPEHNSKKHEVITKIRAKSKDWHRQGLRKISIPTENALAEAIASLVPSREESPARKDPSDHSDRVLHGEKKSEESVENIRRRHSKLINSSRLLYQEYSDVALNKAIQSQKRVDSLSEELELGPAESRNTSRLRRKEPHSQDSCLQRLSVSSSASLWQDIPMVRGSTMLLSMTREEQKLQEVKFELIASEASYLRSLNVAVDHFQHSPELQAVLTNQEKQWLFSRLQDVRDVSANFLFDLEEKLEENMFTFDVCDVALKHAPEFCRVYLPYVTNQTYQEQTFKRLLHGLPAFQQVLEKLESDPICQRLSLKSFLILPFQRITRLKLLLQNILKRTPPGADEEVQATQAYDALEKLIKDCNENVQRMKNTEELIYLSKNMEFECKIFPLISQSRRLVKRGELTALEYNLSLKWKLTTRPIYLHLFNDFLLLSRPRENGHFIVFDYAASSQVRGEKCEMKLHGTNKNVFRLFLLQNNQGKKVEFLFRTETQSEKLRWISALTPQQAEPDLLDDSDAPQVQCVKSYKARENDELALEKADIIMVLQQSTDGWMEGVKLSDGEKGWFPAEQVEAISSRHARQMNLKEEQRVKNAKQQVFRGK